MICLQLSNRFLGSHPVSKRAMVVKIKHTRIPITVGSRKASKVHLKLPVSLRIVRQVVEHGQCIRQKSMVEIAVIEVHPWDNRRDFSSVKLPNSKRLPVDIYAIIIMGTTISFAGKPKIKASRITPSSPNNLANGSKNSEQIARILASPIITLAISQIISPAGAATNTALPRTNRVRSNKERRIT